MTDGEYLESMTGRSTALRTVWIAVTDRGTVEPFHRPGPPHRLLEAMHAREGENAADFHRRVNSFIEKEANRLGAVPIRLYVPN